MDMLPIPFSRGQALGPRVLFVDDDEDDLFLIRQAFAEGGKPGQYYSTTDGEDCLRFLEATPLLPDLILLDLNMPRLDGIEVLRHLQAAPQWRDMIVVVLSTCCDASTQRLVQSLGAADCQRKPSRQADYQPLVHELYERYLYSTC